MIDENKVTNIKKQYPKGTEIELINMVDPQPVPSGTHGIVEYIDDIGTIFIKWDNGSSLGLIADADKFKVIKRPNPALKELEKARKRLDDNDNLLLFTYNNKTKNTGVASFILNKNKVKVFEGNSDGSDDTIMDYDKFINNYKFKVDDEDADPFKDIREDSYNYKDFYYYHKDEHRDNVISKLKEKYSLSVYYENLPLVIYHIDGIGQNIFIEHESDRWIGVYKDDSNNMEKFNPSKENCFERIVLYIEDLRKDIRI